MKIYRITCELRAAVPRFAATRADAHKIAKTMPDAFETIVELVEVETHLESILKLVSACFDGEVKPPEFKVLRTWELTARGGLSELKA